MNRLCVGIRIERDLAREGSDGALPSISGFFMRIRAARFQCFYEAHHQSLEATSFKIRHARVSEAFLNQEPHDRVPLLESLGITLPIFCIPHPDVVLTERLAEQATARMPATEDRVRTFQFAALHIN